MGGPAMTTPSGYESASGLAYTLDGPIDEFVRYIYAEYWADDLINDKFVPDECICKHFSEDISWEYGGACTNEMLPIAGRYTGHAGMSSALKLYGELLRVKRWETKSIVLTPDDPTERKVSAFIELSVDYEVRASGTPLSLQEVHVLRINRRGTEDEPQITSVRIMFDELAMSEALAFTGVLHSKAERMLGTEATPQTQPQPRQLSKVERMLGAEAPPQPPSQPRQLSKAERMLGAEAPPQPPSQQQQLSKLQRMLGAEAPLQPPSQQQQLSKVEHMLGADAPPQPPSQQQQLSKSQRMLGAEAPLPPPSAAPPQPKRRTGRQALLSNLQSVVAAFQAAGPLLPAEVEAGREIIAQLDILFRDGPLPLPPDLEKSLEQRMGALLEGASNGPGARVGGWNGRWLPAVAAAAVIASVGISRATRA